MSVRTKKILLILASMICSGVMVFSLPSINRNIIKALGNENPTPNYVLSFSSSSNKFHSSEGKENVRTTNGNNITFSYSELSSSSNWQKINSNGYIKNDDPINGLKSICINYISENDNKLLISYGWGENMDVQNALSSSQLYSFNNQYPSYFRIDNLSGTTIDITNIQVTYSCSYVEKPNIDGTYVTSVTDKEYIIDVKSLSISNIEAAYEHALSLDESQTKYIDEILINLPNGKINLHETLSFSGARNNSAPIRFKGNNTTFYGGDELVKGNWSVYQNDIYRTYIGQNLDKFSSLIVNGERKELARSKNLTFTYSYSNRKISFKKSQYDVSSLSGSLGIVTLERWAECIANVTSITKSGTFTVTFSLNLDTNGEYVYYDSTPSYRPTNVTEISGYLQDNIFFLDEAGEWYYSSGDGYLYYKPENASTINEDTFIIPEAETLIDTEGLVSNVIFDGLTFNGTNYARPLEVGFAEQQTSWFVDPETRQGNLISGMVEISSDDTSFINSTFKNSSNISIKVNTSAINVDLTNNLITNSGAGGIYVGYPTKYMLGDIPENITISNNEIAYFGEVYKGGPGISATYVDGLNIINNNIHDGGYSGVAAGWGWLNTQTTYGHSSYHISYNHISNVMNSEFHDGGGIYVLGNFPSQLNELMNEISYNYIEVNYLLNGGIYLDEGSSSWDVHHNVINIIDDNYTHHGAIMMHDPIDANNGTYNSQFANHITNNYYHGDVDGTENKSQLTYQNNGGSYYSGEELNTYNSERNIIFDTPILGNDTHVNENIYQASGKKDAKDALFSNANTFNTFITGANNLSLDNVNNEASFNVTSDGIVLTNNFIKYLINQGYRGLAFTINATSLNEIEAYYAVCFSSGSLSWQVYYTQTRVGNNISIPLDKFDVEGSTCQIKIRDSQGLSQDNNLPASITISNLVLSKFSIMKSTSYDNIQIVESSSNTITYRADNVSYNWKRLQFIGMKDAIKKGYRQVIVSVKGNNHNLYVFKSLGESEVDYNNRILAGNGSVLINLENSDRNISIMTTHERDGSQDETGTYGKEENLVITFKFIKGAYENLLSYKEFFARYISGVTLLNLSNDEANISFINSRMRLNHSLIEDMINNNVSSVEFDLIIPNESDVKSIVTCWYGGPNNSNVSYDGSGSFSISENKIHVILYRAKFVNSYDIQLVSRDENGYSGNDINLENGIMKNLI